MSHPGEVHSNLFSKILTINDEVTGDKGLSGNQIVAYTSVRTCNYIFGELGD